MMYVNIFCAVDIASSLETDQGSGFEACSKGDNRGTQLYELSSIILLINLKKHLIDAK